MPAQCQQVEAWVVRFIRECGLLELGWSDRNLLLTSECYGRWGKGPAACGAGVTVFVDNTSACLWSMAFDPEGNAADTLEVQAAMQSRPSPFAIPG